MSNSADEHFSLFHKAMGAFTAFESVDLIPKSKYPAWSNRPLPPKQTKPRRHAMADPPKLDAGKRLYCQVEKRSLFESGDDQNGILVQLEIHETPAGRRRAAVYIQSKDYPPSSRNIGNVTFKFNKDGEFVVEIQQTKALSALKLATPSWIHPSKISFSTGKRPIAMVPVGSDINPALAQKLLLLADFAGQARSRGPLISARDPKTFHPPR
jgi:hypothetical protein